MAAPPIEAEPGTRAEARAATLTWKELAQLAPDELARCDVAAVNLACAAGLPGAERIDVPMCLARLDYYGYRVQRETKRLHRSFRHHRYDYNNSEAYFRVLVLITVLQRDLGVRYNPAKIPADVPLDTADSFIHGVLFGDGGTCATMPVVYAAVGRRLGYPMKLVLARGPGANHVFARWEGPGGERFNIEATAPGLSCPPDAHYRTGFYATTPKQEEECCYLKSQTPREELAGFLGQRAACWQDEGRHRQAVEALAWASCLAPANVAYLSVMKGEMDRWLRGLQARTPPGFPAIFVRAQQRRFPLSFSAFLEKEIMGLEVTENLLNDAEDEQRWWAPLRAGTVPVGLPTTAFADFDEQGCTVHFGFDGKAVIGHDSWQLTPSAIAR
jgi:hypothetical protein